VCSVVGGIGGGFAIVGDNRRWIAWLGGAVLAVVLGAALTPWLYLLVAAAFVGSTAHAVVRASKTDAPLRLYSSWPLTCLFANVGCVLVLNMFVVGEYVNLSSGMTPAVGPDDRVIVDKISQQWRPIERGDVIVFDRYACSAVHDLGRVVATAGETVELRCGVLYVDSPAGLEVIVDRVGEDVPDFPPSAWDQPFPSRAPRSLDS
jgi:signal peptidase I